MQVVVYGIAGCDKVRAARRWLEAHGIAYDFHDYKKAGIDAATLARWCAAVGWQALINRRGTTWRKLPAAEKSNLDKAKAVALMQAHPSLIRRPVLEVDGRLQIGFDAQRYTSLLQR